MSSALGEGNEGSEASVREVSMTTDERGVKRISQAESVDLVPAAAAVGKGRSYQPHPISKP